VSIGEVTAITFALQAFVTLFVIMDPPGSIPIFLGLVSDKSPATRRKLAWQAAAVSMVVITSFALFGRLVLSYLNISLESLQAAGGLLLLIVSLELLMGGRQGSENKKSNNIALVPLGTPLLAGPGAIDLRTKNRQRRTRNWISRCCNCCSPGNRLNSDGINRNS
jgi:multiple antibiotic resistance protein